MDRFTRSHSNTNKDTRPIAERRADNDRQFERLRQWEEALRRQKASMLPTDVKGSQAYAVDLQEYNEALLLANAEKQALAGR